MVIYSDPETYLTHYMAEQRQQQAFFTFVFTFHISLKRPRAFLRVQLNM